MDWLIAVDVAKKAPKSIAAIAILPLLSSSAIDGA